MNYSNLSDNQLMALCVWREARSEGPKGMRGVAHVIQNRVTHPKWWGHDIRSVILAPWQFSSFNTNDPQSGKVPCNNSDPDTWGEDPEYPLCASACENVLAGTDEDLTEGANSYYDISIGPPKWAGTSPYVAIGRLRFYKL